MTEEARRVDSVFKEKSGSFKDLRNGASSGFTSALGDLGNDAKNLGIALSQFPYSSFFKIIGIITILYICFSFVNKFVNIEEKLLNHLKGKQ